mgnify:CR=1 FL=1
MPANKQDKIKVQDSTTAQHQADRSSDRQDKNQHHISFCMNVLRLEMHNRISISFCTNVPRPETDISPDNLARQRSDIFCRVGEACTTTAWQRVPQHRAWHRELGANGRARRHRATKGGGRPAADKADARRPMRRRCSAAG